MAFVVVLKCVPHAGWINGSISNSVTKLNHVCKCNINIDTQEYEHHSQTLPDDLDIITPLPPPLSLLHELFKKLNMEKVQ